MVLADHRPLAGKRIVVTRASEQSREFIEELAALGAEVIAFPLIEILPVEDPAPLDQAIRNLASIDWLILTSQNAVAHFSKRSVELGISPKNLSANTQVAAVGPSTAKAAGLAGYPVHFVSPEPRGMGLAAGLYHEVKGKRVLLPRSDRAGSELPAALRVAGAEVVEVIAYRTAAPEEMQAETLETILSGQMDVITFASPSAFERLSRLAGLETLHRIAARVAFATVGPVTTRAIRQAGLPVAIEAVQPSSEGFAAAIVKYYAAPSHERVTSA